MTNSDNSNLDNDHDNNHDNKNQQPVITAVDVPNLPDILQRSHIDMPLVTVFCGAKLGNNPAYQEASYQLGRALRSNGFGLVYGGASVGLMGAVADGVIADDESTEASTEASTAMAIGVLPTFMMKFELAHQQLTKLHYTDTMHTRKAIMAEYADAFVVLPGGVGTLDEIMEISTWRQLELHSKPMILMNIEGYYEPLIAHLRHAEQEGFIKQSDIKNLVVCNNIEDALTVLKQVKIA